MKIDEHRPLPGSADEKPLSLLNATLWKDPDGQVFVAGLVIALSYIGWLTIGMVNDPEIFQKYMTLSGSHMFAGRAAGITTGYYFKLDHAPVIILNCIVETIMVLIFYPLFVFSWRRLVLFSFLKKLMTKIGNVAESKQESIRHYGIYGLFVFVLFPFWMTGPVIGSAIGHLMGLRSWVNMSVVLGGTYAATVGLALFLHEISNFMAEFHNLAPLALVLGLVVLGLAGHLLNRSAKS